MKWTPEAEAALKKVPFFVRKKVRQRVEQETAEQGRSTVTLNGMKATQKRYLNRMASEVKGYQLDSCFGPSGCPNRANQSEKLVEQIDSLLQKADLLDFLKRSVHGPLKFHHEFRITVAECPNACSQPQIKDIGIIGSCTPIVTDVACSACEDCIEACPDDAVTLEHGEAKPVIDLSKCMHCGKCTVACPTGTLAESAKGYKILLGGKLGRHPKLARELPGIYDDTRVLQIINDCIDYYKQHSQNGRRFAELVDQNTFNNFAVKYGKHMG